VAKRSLKDELKKEGRSIAKKSVKKGAKKLINTAADGFDGGRGKKGAPKRNIVLKILPYFTVVFALILAVFFVTVHVFGGEAGFVGYYVQYAMGGLLGGAAVLLPLALGYMGVKWCIYNIKWKEDSMSPRSDSYDDYKKARGRLVLQSIMSFLVVLTVSCLFGVLTGSDVTYGIDVSELWTSGAEDFLLGGGGIIGGGLGGLLVAGVKEISSVIILAVLLIVFGLLTFGLTPDYIITKIQAASAKAKERRIEKAELRRAEEEKAAKDAQTAKTAAAKVTESSVTTKLKSEAEPLSKDAKGMSSDDILFVSEDEPQQTAEKSGNDKDEDIVSQMFAEPTSKSKEKGGDFGGEPGFDADGEFDPIEDFLADMDLNTDTGEVIDIAPEAPVRSEISTDELIDIHEIESEDIRSDMAAVAPDESEGDEEEEEPPTPYIFPPIDMLIKGKSVSEAGVNDEIQANARLLVSTLQSFKINIKEINCSRGPTITRYELKPEAGVRVRSIANLVDDISLSLATSGVRIEAPIPGKAAVGIEVPNRNRATVYLRELIENSQFTEAKSRLTASLGMDVGGNPIYFDISKMPHMLIAGATGMGKSVCINCIIISLLYKARPEDLKLILIDPKKVEFNIYKDIPHLYAPIVSDPKKAAGALASAVAEMERRFELIEEVGVRDIASYNAATENDPYKEHMPHMVIIIDELADLMMTAPDEVETAICRLAQKARAAGIHIIIGTQRPSVDVITGLIKANIPSRIACTVASQVDSRTIIDIAGAEKLIGRGDMLFAPVGAAKPMRVQGAFVTDSEVENIVSYIRDNNAKAKYNAEFINRLEEEAAKCGVKKGASGGGDISSLGGDDATDSKFQAAVKLAVEEGKISTSLMQRRLGVGYGRAAKIIDSMEEKGYVSKPDGNKPRRVLLTAEEYAKRVTEGTLGGDDE